MMSEACDRLIGGEALAARVAAAKMLVRVGESYRCHVVSCGSESEISNSLGR